MSIGSSNHLSKTVPMDNKNAGGDKPPAFILLYDPEYFNTAVVLISTAWCNCATSLKNKMDYSLCPFFPSSNIVMAFWILRWRVSGFFASSTHSTYSR